MSSLPDSLKLIGDVTVTLSVELGRTQMALKDVMALGEESVVVLDRLTDELLDVCVNGKAIAKAEVIAQDNRFALRIVEVPGENNAAVAGLSSTATAQTAAVSDLADAPANEAAS